MAGWGFQVFCGAAAYLAAYVGWKLLIYFENCAGCGMYRPSGVNAWKLLLFMEFCENLEPLEDEKPEFIELVSPFFCELVLRNLC